MSEDRHEIERDKLIRELDAEMRRWQHLNVRRGVLRLVEVARERFTADEFEFESRHQAAGVVVDIGMEGRWLPCDIVAASEGIRTGQWATIEEPVCSVCRKKEDVGRG
jgi:hypothetical protein